MKFISTKEKRESLLKKLKIGFLIPSSCLILAIIVSYLFNWLLFGGILFLIAFACLELFMAFFWILNLIMMWKFKKRVLFFFAIVFPFISLIFYIYDFYPFLKGKKDLSRIPNK